MTTADPARTVAALTSDDGVLAVERAGVVRAAAAPNDPLYRVQWNLQALGPANPGTANWEPVHPGTTGAGVLVAVLDSGFRPGGPDAPTVRSDIDRDFVEDDDEPQDEAGHGTFVASLIAQSTGNDHGLAGVAPGASILPLRVLDAAGEGSTADVVRAINWALDRGASVINLSLAGDVSPGLCTAVAAASQRAVVVAATGNFSTPGTRAPVAFPAACPGAVGVGAVTVSGDVAAYSNAGCAISLVAPGGDFQDRFKPGDGNPDAIAAEGFDENGFGSLLQTGTSMAAAHVAGAAALVMEAGAAPAAVPRILRGTARDGGPVGFDPTFGAGMLDIAAAVSAVRAGDAVPLQDRGIVLVSGAGEAATLHDGCSGGVTEALSEAPAAPTVDVAATPTGAGFWMAAADGGVFTSGDAMFHGSTGALRLNAPIVGIAATPTGHGYWLVASDGGIFSFGDAMFFGSTGAIRLNAPIVGMTPTPIGLGYWLVASDGGIFSFGDAMFFGSTAAVRLNAPIVGMGRSSRGDGYWLAGADGGLFAFGAVRSFGSAVDIGLVAPVTGMTLLRR